MERPTTIRLHAATAVRRRSLPTPERDDSRGNYLETHRNDAAERDFVDAVKQSPGREDRINGCDILALPARRSDGQWGFVCPECGRVG